MGHMAAVEADLEADRPEGSRDTPAVPGHTVERTERRDGARRRIDLLVHPEGDTTHHVTLRLDLMPGRTPLLSAGFAAAVREVCLPEHLEPQDAAVEAAAAALAQLSEAGDADPLVARLRALWAVERARLEKRQSALLKKGRLAQRLVVCRDGGSYQPVLIAERTRIARNRGGSSGMGDHPYGMRLEDGAPRSVNLAFNKPVPLTQKDLAGIAGISGHEKLALLAGADSPDPRMREGFRSGPRAVPIPREGWIAYGGGSRDAVEVHTAEGAKGWVSVDRPRLYSVSQDIDPYLSLSADGAGRGHSIRIHTSNRISGIQKPPSIKRKHGGGGFPSVAELDAMLRLLLEMVVAADLGVDDVRIVPGKRVLSADEVAAHPLLAGLDLPAGLVAPLAAILGSPYDHARRVAGRAEARTVKKAASLETAGRIVDDLPDGTLVGRLDTHDFDRSDPADVVHVQVSNRTKFGIVRTRPAPNGDGTRYRVVAPVHGTSEERPLDVKLLARMGVIGDPLALRHMQDAFAGRMARDHVETAFRLSFRLRPGARNPLLDGAGNAKNEGAEGDLILRHTISPGDGRTWAQAFAVSNEPRGLHDPLATGAGFVITVQGEEVEYYLRPARTQGRSTLPDEHRVAIEGALRRHLPDRAPAALRALDVLWSRGPHSEACTL